MSEQPSPAERARLPTGAELSDWELEHGLTETGEPRAVVLRMSQVAQREHVRELTPRDLLQHKVLWPVVKFFIYANTATGIAVFALAGLETLLPPTHVPIVTEKVIIALIGGLTVQVGAVIIAAFRGLFSDK